MRFTAIAALVVLFAGLILLGAVAASFFALFRPWLQAAMSGTPVSILKILGMRLRGNPPWLIISAYTSLVHAGSDLPIDEVESVYIANRGRIRNAQDLVDAVQAEDAGQAETFTH